MPKSHKNGDKVLHNRQNTRNMEATNVDTENDGVTMPAPAGDTSTVKGKRKASSKIHKDDGGPNSPGGTSDAKLIPNMVEPSLQINSSLGGDLEEMDQTAVQNTIRKVNATGIFLSLSGGKKNLKDMASHKFWQTQPVPRFDDTEEVVREGPIKIIDPDTVPKQPDPLLEGFEWSTLDLTDESELKELYELLANHYVEDGNSMFRFNYSRSFLNWALKSPGWKKDWHVGVRASKSRKLIASICAVPTEIRVRGQRMKVTEINFLCIHKKLRSKRLAPVLIKEITRRCYLSDIHQAIYTAGVVLPKPVSSCRYYHRPLDWLKLYEVGFSPPPTGSTKARQITKYHLPGHPATPGFRPMQARDIDAVHGLLERYMQRFDLNQAFTKEEINHWLLNKEQLEDQVVWSYVVEEEHTHKITDFVSFYSLESSVIQNPKHKEIRAAYLYYYASETAFAEREWGLKDRLTMLINDALIMAKKARLDVFNALTLHDNPLFLEQLKFGPGDGQLHYYLFNYRAAPIPGGISEKNLPDIKRRGGVGVVLL